MWSWNPQFFMLLLTKIPENFVDLQFITASGGQAAAVKEKTDKNMKQFSTKNSGIIKAICVVVLLVFAGMKTANACHGVALVGIIQNNTGTSMTLDGSSDAATCGCGPYYLEVEVTCQPTFAGNPYATETDPQWNTAGQPYYHSILNIPGYSAPSWTDNCAVEPYTQLVIPFVNLCPGTLYHWRYRERPMTGTPSGWFNLTDFTTSGSPPASILVATSELLSTGNPQYSGCPGDLFQLDASVSGGCPGATYAFQWTPATGLSNPNIPNPVCTLSTNITYTVTTAGGCFTITNADDTVQLSVGPPPSAGIPTATPSGLCSGQSAWVVLGGQGAGSIQWQVSTNGINWFNVANATNDSLNTGPLSSTLFYHAIVTGTGWPGSGCGSSTSPAVQVTVNQSPVADAGANTSVCAGGCTNLTGTGGVSYTWMPGNLTGSTVNVCPPASTTYTLYITDANGCSDSDVVSINISIPNVTASPSVSVCNGNSTILVASGPAGQTYAWTPSATLTGANTANPTATPTATTTYTVTATNAFGCTAVDSVLVQVTTAPPIIASQDTSLCNGGAATLTVSGASTYSWSPGNLSGSSVTVSPVNTTTYVVTGNTNNCISTDTVIVNVAPPFAVYAGPDFSVCGGTQVTLNVGVSGGSYSWTPSASIIGSNTTQSVVAAPTGNTSYTVNVTDANGCVSADTINVTVNAQPNVVASSPDLILCQGETAFLNAVGGQSYVWTPNISLSSNVGPNVTATPSNTTTYLVTGTDANGCMDTSSITVVVNTNPQASFSSSASICGGTTGGIQLVGILGNAPFTYQIGSTPSPMPVSGLAPGNYNVTYTDVNGCTGLVGVTVFSIDPLLSFTSYPTECGDTSGQILLDVVTSGVAPFTYQIGSTTYPMPISGLAAGNYNVVYTDANGCTGTTGVTVFTQNTAYVNASADPSFGTYPLAVNFGAAGSNGLTNWIWTFGDNNSGTGQTPSNTYGAPGVYEVVVMAYNSSPGCAVYDTIYVTVVEEATIALPNIFTPNDDANNDFFMATVSGVQEISVDVYDRWGALIHSEKVSGLASTPQLIQLWDGKNGGKSAADGVYYYVVNATGYDQKTYPMQGFVHLITTK